MGVAASRPTGTQVLVACRELCHRCSGGSGAHHGARPAHGARVGGDRM